MCLQLRVVLGPRTIATSTALAVDASPALLQAIDEAGRLLAEAAARDLESEVVVTIEDAELLLERRYVGRPAAGG